MRSLIRRCVAAEKWANDSARTVFVTRKRSDRQRPRRIAGSTAPECTDLNPGLACVELAQALCRIRASDERHRAGGTSDSGRSVQARGKQEPRPKMLPLRR